MREAVMSDPSTNAWWAVVGPDEGESQWQPLPSRGYVTLKLTPETTPYDTFTSGIQVLPPGCHVREHGHRQNHELIFIHEGTGRVVNNWPGRSSNQNRKWGNWPPSSPVSAARPPTFSRRT